MAFLKFKNTRYVGVSYTLVAVVLVLGMAILGVIMYPPLLTVMLSWILILSPLWAPMVLLSILWNSWKKYVRARYIASQKPVLLELKVPRSIQKTPRAMEQVFAGLNFGPGETTFLKRWWEGKVRPWFSFEIVSIEGTIHFYVWVWSQHVEYVQTQFYAQYPDLEIHEVEDYTAGIKFDQNINDVWGMEYQLAKPDPYPIKTYVDFELDKEAKKVEQIIDPLSSIFERLSDFGSGQQFWIQIIARQNKGAKIRNDLWNKNKKWTDETQELINEIYKNATPKNKEQSDGAQKAQQDDPEGYPLLKPAEVTVIKALERSLDKPGFDVGIRAVLVGQKDSFPGHKIPTHIVGLWNSLNSNLLNKFNPADMWHISLDYPWEDFMKIRENGFKQDLIDAYRRRSMFHPPYQHPRFVLTTEEMATIFHFPTEETRAPGVDRVTSTKGAPPANLPI